MKTITLFAVAVALSFAQVAPTARQQAKIDVSNTPDQKAQDVTVHLDAKTATALERMRRSIIEKPVSDPATGVMSAKPKFASISELLDNVLNGTVDDKGTRQGGFLQSIKRNFPSADAKAKRDAAEKLLKEAEGEDTSLAVAPKK